MISGEQLEDLKPFQARSIIEELRKGSVPLDYVPVFTVGRENWLKFIEDDLDHYIAEGGAKVRFVSGDYGDGKTHFMSVISNVALQKGFAVSFVVLTREVPIHKFEVAYQAIVRQLRTSHAPEVSKPSKNPRKNPKFRKPPLKAGSGFCWITGQTASPKSVNSRRPSAVCRE